MNVLSRRLGYFLTPQLTIYQNLAPYVTDKRVLEVGFGTGFGTLQYARYTHDVMAIEIDRGNVEWAEWCMPIPNVTWMQGDICAGVLGKYDVCVMIEVIEHIPRWQEALSRCRELLVPGGKLIISTPNANGTFQKNPLHGDEWTAKEFYDRLSMYSEDVTLYNFTLKEEKGVDTRVTPLVAVCG